MPQITLYSRSNNFSVNTNQTTLYSRSNNFTVSTPGTQLYSTSNNFSITANDPWIPGYIQNFKINTGNPVSYLLKSEFEKSYGIRYDFVISSKFFNNILVFYRSINSIFLNNYVLENFDIKDNFLNNYQNVFFNIKSSFDKIYDESIKPPNENCYNSIIDGKSVDSNQISNDKMSQNIFGVFLDYYITEYNSFNVIILNIEKILNTLVINPSVYKYDSNSFYNNQLNTEISKYKNYPNKTESFIDFSNFVVKNKDNIEINVNATVNYTEKTMSFYIDNNINEVSIEYKSNNKKGKYKIGRFNLS